MTSCPSGMKIVVKKKKRSPTITASKRMLGQFRIVPVDQIAMSCPAPNVWDSPSNKRGAQGLRTSRITAKRAWMLLHQYTRFEVKAQPTPKPRKQSNSAKFLA